MKKILVIRFPYTFQDLELSLVYQGVDCEVLNIEENIDIISQLDHEIITGGYDRVMSYIFNEAVSDYCESKGLTYICYIYDSPLNMMFSRSLFNSCNRLIIFDRMEYERIYRLKQEGVYYLPLGANIDRIGLVDITPEDESIYSHDISFVGNLYEDNSYNSVIHLFPQEYQLKLKLYLAQNMCNWKETRKWPALEEDIVCFVKSQLKWANPYSEYLNDSTFFGISLLSKKLAELDRTIALNTLASKHDLHMYTYSNTSNLQGVHVHPGVDYNSDMIKVMYLSRINLNITLPSIETGLPQRLFDIMGSGGFVLTNYQAEIEEYFKIGQEIEVFRDLDELSQKVDYYLSHEKERLTVAINGYKKVRSEFDFKNQVLKVLKLAKVPI